MTPTLTGRIQTRLALLATVAVVWTVLVVPIIKPSRVDTSDAYSATFWALIFTGVMGTILWEPLYHLLQQWRWEKDWPIGIGLLVGIPEGLLTLQLVESRFEGGVPGWMFFLHFTSTWILVWLIANGPLRVVLLRWRFRGGRVI